MGSQASNPDRSGISSNNRVISLGGDKKLGPFQVITRTVGGQLEFGVSKNSFVVLAYYDKDGMMILSFVEISGLLDEYHPASNGDYVILNIQYNGGSGYEGSLDFTASIGTESNTPASANSNRYIVAKLGNDSVEKQYLYRNIHIYGYTQEWFSNNYED